MHFYPNERVALFIDGANLHATVKALSMDIDYKRLLGIFRERARLVRAHYYTVLVEEQEYSSLRPLVDWLDYNGYTVVSKAAKEFVDANGRRKIKGSMEVELSVDAMRHAPNLDHVVLVTGDGAYRWLAHSLQQLGKRVSVISTMQTQPHMIADDLRRQVDQFIDLGDLEPLIGRPTPPLAQRRETRLKLAVGSVHEEGGGPG